MTIDEKVEYIVQNCRKRIMKITGKPVTLILFNNKKESIVTYDEVVKAVCDVTEIPYSRALTRTRKREVVITRQLIFFYAHIYGRISHSTIADALGYSEHSTSIHSIKKIRDLMDANDSAIMVAIKRINHQLKITS